MYRKENKKPQQCISFGLKLTLFLIVSHVQHSTNHQVINSEPSHKRITHMRLINFRGSTLEHKYPLVGTETKLRTPKAPTDK